MKTSHDSSKSEMVQDDADQSSKNEGMTPLLIAARTGNLKLVEDLLNNGADIKAVNKEGHNLLVELLKNSEEKFHSNKELYKELILKCGNNGVKINVQPIPEEIYFDLITTPKEVKEIFLNLDDTDLVRNYSFIFQKAYNPRFIAIVASDEPGDELETKPKPKLSNEQKQKLFRSLFSQASDESLQSNIYKLVSKTQENRVADNKESLKFCLQEIAKINDKKTLGEIFSQNSSTFIQPSVAQDTITSLLEIKKPRRKSRKKKEEESSENKDEFLPAHQKIKLFLDNTNIDLIKTHVNITPKSIEQNNNNNQSTNSVPLFYFAMREALDENQGRSFDAIFDKASSQYEGDILDLPMENGQPFLKYALDNDDNVFCKLIEKANINQDQFFSIAKEIDSDSLFKVLERYPNYAIQKDEKGNNLLLLACVNEKLTTQDISKLMELGASFDYQNLKLKDISFENLCTIVKKYPDQKLIEKILEEHPKYLQAKDSQGNTILNLLLKSNASKELISSVIEKNPDLLRSTKPVVLDALNYSDKNKLEFLLQKGADIEPLNKLSSNEEYAASIDKLKDNVNLCGMLIAKIPANQVQKILDCKIADGVTLEQSLSQHTNYKTIAQLFERQKNGSIPIPEKFTDPKFLSALEKIQTTFSANRGKTQLSKVVDIEAEAKKNTHNLVSPGKDELSSIKREFLQEALTIPYYMRHGVANNESFPLILESGHLLSETKLIAMKNNNKESAKEENVGALNGDFDRQHKAHYFAFFGLGTDKDNLPAPSGLRGEAGYFILNNDEFAKSQKDQAKHLVVKGEDWGAMHNRQIDINGVKIDVEYPKILNGKVTDHRIYYTYTEENGTEHNYFLKVKEELAYGNDYKKGVAGFVLKHLDKLPEEAQKKILAPVAAAKTPEEKQKAISNILTKFYFPEASIGGSMPLKLEYVDIISYPASEKLDKLDLKLLRDNIRAGNFAAVKGFMEKYPHAQKIPFVVEGALRIANQGKDKDMIAYFDDMYSKTLEPKKFKGITKVSEEFGQIKELQHLILENKSENTKLISNNDGLIFSTIAQHGIHSNDTHIASLSQLHSALGDKEHIGKPATFDGYQEYQVPMKNPADEKRIRDNLLSFELTTLLTSAQNFDYFIEHGKQHPKTGKGATESTIANIPNRLDGYNIKASENKDGHVIIEVDNPEKIATVRKHLCETLKIEEQDIISNGNQLEIKMPVEGLITKMSERKTKHQWVIPVDENGNVMVKYSKDKGSDTSNGHCYDPYHPELGAIIELQKEFGSELKNPKDLLKNLTLISKDGQHKNIGVFTVKANDCRKSEEVNNNSLKAERKDFVENGGEVMSYQDMRGKKFRKEMPLETLLKQDEVMIRKGLPNGLKASVDSSIIEQDGYKIPSSSFGVITFTTESLLDTKVLELQLKSDLFGSGAKIIEMRDKTLKIDGINPKKLNDLMSVKKQEKGLSSYPKVGITQTQNKGKEEVKGWGKH